MQTFKKKVLDVQAEQWFKHGDLGEVVTPFKDPKVKPQRPCKHCKKWMKSHGWVKTREGGHIVCPSDWIITGVVGEHYPCKHDIFKATYEPVGVEQDVPFVALPKLEDEPTDEQIAAVVKKIMGPPESDAPEPPDTQEPPIAHEPEILGQVAQKRDDANADVADAIAAGATPIPSDAQDGSLITEDGVSVVPGVDCVYRYIEDCHQVVKTGKIVGGKAVFIIGGRGVPAKTMKFWITDCSSSAEKADGASRMGARV